MKQNYTYIELREEKSVSKKVIKDFQGDWDTHRKDWKNAKDEEGVMFYSFYENSTRTRMQLKGVDPCGDGYIMVLTRY